ncbi:hypothetical protein PSI19_20060, partial [Xenorhabdus khoisanae]|uniref:hypothetical protein n=1 Tax=Xenorhabdus khoisanae TaxID=880157 RepID=UPI00235899B5
MVVICIRSLERSGVEIINKRGMYVFQNWFNNCLDKGKAVIYQDFYNRGFSEKPEFIIDIHDDLDKYSSVNLGSVDERLKHAYLSSYWSRETIVAFHYDEEISTLFIDVDLPEI